MSWWTSFRDTVESPFTGIGGLAENIGGKITHGVLGLPTEDEKRNQQYAINDQIKAYKDATALSAKQLAATQAEKDVVKRQINEKQIRSLRNQYRPSGFLNNQGSTLGAGNSDLSNKLGT